MDFTRVRDTCDGDPRKRDKERKRQIKTSGSVPPSHDSRGYE